MKRLGVVLALAAALLSAAPGGGTLRFCVRQEPKSLDPMLASEEAADTIRFLTAGVLLRYNRKLQKVEPELAAAYKVSEQGRVISFQLRPGLRFSDGTPFDSADVEYSLRRLADPELNAPSGEIFRSSARILAIERKSAHSVLLRLAAPVAGLDELFDDIPMMSSRSPKKQRAVLGPFQLAEYVPGQGVRLDRNPHYWKRDAQGQALPYLDSIRIDIQANREIELLRFQRGELHFINTLDAESFARLAAGSPSEAVDAGPSLDYEMLWFNQNPRSPLPEYKKQWFRSRAFRRAMSDAISRADIVRLVARGRGREAGSPFSPANAFWSNPKVQPPKVDLAAARARLSGDGFTLRNGVLYDRGGHPVEFSLITNAGNKVRARIAALVQEDLAKLGVKLNFVPLDFASLLERMNKSFDYEACLLGIVGIDTDPNDQANVWMSSSSHHSWNPQQAKPETPWEAEIDRLMRLQSTSFDPQARRRAVFRLQEIVAEEAPVLFLLHPNSLLAVSRSLSGAEPVAVRPRLLWNVERLRLNREVSARP